MKALLFALLFALVAPLRADSPAPVAHSQSITEVILWWGGYQAVFAEVQADAANNAFYSFRFRATLNHGLANMMRLAEPTGAYIIAYFDGRASAFDQLADLAGEPPGVGY